MTAVLFFEVDIRAELEDTTETGYIRLKTQKLLDFGAEKVIWILTKPRQVIIATPDGKWQLLDWDLDIELFLGHNFNIGQYMKNEGINLEVVVCQKTEKTVAGRRQRESG